MHNNKTQVIYCSIIIVVSVLLSIHPMFSSTYSGVENSMYYYLATIVPWIVGFIATVKYIKKISQVYALTFVAILTIGNASAMPLLQYTSSRPSEVEVVIAYSKALCLNNFLCVAVALICFSSLVASKYLYTKIEKKLKFVFYTYIFISIFVSLAILLLTKKASDASNTTIIKIGSLSFQAAIPVMIFSIIGVALSWKDKSVVKKSLYLGSVGILNLILILRGETGIPFILFIGFSVWYLFCQPFHYKYLSCLIFGLSGIGVSSTFILHAIRSYISNGTFLYSISEKIEGRIFSSSVDQVSDAQYSIATGGIWGGNGYNIYVSEGSSDFSIATICHYNGFAYIILLLCIAVPLFISTFKDIMNSKPGFGVSLKGMSLSCLFVMLFYNFLMCFDILPVLGSQIPFTGVTMMYTLLSGFILACIFYEDEIAGAVMNKLKTGGLSNA